MRCCYRLWWQNNGVEVPHVREVALKLTSLLDGSGDAERNWKAYKGGVSKKRSRMGEVSAEIFRAVAEDEDVDLDVLESSGATTGTKLATVHGSMHCDEYNDYNLSDVAAELRNFDIKDHEAVLEIFDAAQRRSDAADGRPVFRNYIEDWESNLVVQNEEVETKLRAKYMGMRLHDVEVDPNDPDNSYDEKRLINNIIWKPSRKEKGFYVSTALIKDNGRADLSEDKKDTNIISESLHAVVTPIMNPGFSFVDNADDTQ